MIARLEKEGILDQTLVIFMTDHGISHARGKQFLYDEGTHVPLVVRGPGIAKGEVRDDLVEHIDLAAISLAPRGLRCRSRCRPAMSSRRTTSPATPSSPRATVAMKPSNASAACAPTAYLYIRNFHPQRPHLQPNAYKDGKAIVQALRALHGEGKLMRFRKAALQPHPSARGTLRVDRRPLAGEEPRC